MIKITLLIISAILTAVACVWFVQNDGNVNIEWLGYNIEISIALLILIILIVTLAMFILTSMVFWLLKLPSNFKQKRKIRIKEKGFESLARGFVAIAEGDTNKAKSYSRDAKKKLNNVSAINLLQAQAYQLEGDDAQAKSQYNILLENKDTEILGVKGLVIQAEKEENFKEAVYLAERAKKRDSKLEWTNRLLLRLYKNNHDWDKAQVILGDLVKFGSAKKQDIERENAILNLCISYNYNEKGEFEVALRYAKKAFIVLENYLPAIYAYASLLFKIGNKNKAKKIIEISWASNASFYLADLYMQVISDLLPAKQLKIVKKLVKINPKATEGHHIVAKAAIDAGQLDIARDYLESAISITQTRKLYDLMIDLEKLDSGNEYKINKLKIKALSFDSETKWQSSEEDLICGNWLPSDNYITPANSGLNSAYEEIKLHQIDADKYIVNQDSVQNNKEETLILTGVQSSSTQSSTADEPDEEVKPVDDESDQSKSAQQSEETKS